jgi:hypothetical protein
VDNLVNKTDLVNCAPGATRLYEDARSTKHKILQWIILPTFIVLILCIVFVLNLCGFPRTEFVLHNFLAGAFQNMSLQGFFI